MGTVKLVGRKIENLMRAILKPAKPDIPIYFISGMCYNCKVFDHIELPEGYCKKYIEWIIPEPGISLDRYVHEMAETIDTKHNFILVGYSFGAVIMQEMNRFLHPLKSIVISSFKDKKEIPPLFKAVKRIRLAERIPLSTYSHTELITNTFNRLVYKMPTEQLAEYMTVTDPLYMKWAVDIITRWVPENKCPNLCHIHGTDDQIFPYERLDDVYTVEGGDHLMVLKKADSVSAILKKILPPAEQVNQKNPFSRN